MSALTVTLSKKASTGARNFASAAMAPSKSSEASAFDLLAHRAGCGVERFFFLLLEELVGGRAVEAARVFLLFDLQDVECAAHQREQARAVFRFEEAAQRLYPAHDYDQIVLPRQGEDGVDQVVTRALVRR